MTGHKQYPLSRRNALKVFAATTVAISCLAFAQTGEKITQEAEKMEIIVIVEFDVKTDQVPKFTVILDSVKADLPKVEGCVSVEIYMSSSSASKFTLVETWETKELHQAHINRLAKDGSWDEIASHLVKDPRSGYYTQL